jgi:hypothetical protein
MTKMTWPPSIDEVHSLKQINQAPKMKVDMYLFEEATKQDPDSINEEARVEEAETKRTGTTNIATFANS